MTRAGDKSPSSSFIPVFLPPSMVDAHTILPPLPSLIPTTTTTAAAAAAAAASKFSRKRNSSLSLSLSAHSNWQPRKRKSENERASLAEERALTQHCGSRRGRAADRDSKLDLFNDELCYHFSRQEQCLFGIEMFNGRSPLKTKGGLGENRKQKITSPSHGPIRG